MNDLNYVLQIVSELADSYRVNEIWDDSNQVEAKFGKSNVGIVGYHNMFEVEVKEDGITSIYFPTSLDELKQKLIDIKEGIM